MVPLSDKNGENFKTPSFDEEDEMEHEYRRICQLLETIPDEQAEVIRLRFYGEKSFKEIADIIGVNLSTVKSRFMYGLEKIRRGMRASSASDNNHQTIVMYEV
jgi:RNA polymerase sigma-70 factor (ECF subfamily)